MENLAKTLKLNRRADPDTRDNLYLIKDKFNELGDIELSFQSFNPSNYSQTTSSFVSHLSILDTVANIGWDGTRKYIS
jgi:hypothetical protein